MVCLVCLVCLVYLVCLVCLVYLVGQDELDERNKPNEPNEPVCLALLDRHILPPMFTGIDLIRAEQFVLPELFQPMGKPP